MAKQTLLQISDQNWAGGIMPTFLMGGKYGGPLIPPGGIGGLGGYSSTKSWRQCTRRKSYRVFETD